MTTGMELPTSRADVCADRDVRAHGSTGIKVPGLPRKPS
jgi:hypothetical protein